MSTEFWLRGRLSFDAKGRKAAEAELDEEGYDQEESVFGDEDLVWTGDELTVDVRGSSSYDDFDNSACMLSIYARHAKSGEAFAINIEDGVGDRYTAGAEGAELDDDEVDAMRTEYGWKKG